MISPSELLDGFEGMYSDGEDVRLYTKKVIRTRARHNCPGMFSGQLHEFPAGSYAVVERALVDGKWASCYTCADCMEKWNSASKEQP